MSSSSRPRRRRAAAALVAAAVTGALGWAATAGAASAVEVVAVLPAPDTATVVVAVRPPPSLTRPGVFRVDGPDGRPLGLDTRAVVTPQLLTGIVVDTSGTGAEALQAGINGASSSCSSCRTARAPRWSGTAAPGRPCCRR